MSGPGDAASIWQALTMKAAQGSPDLEKDWAALCAAWTKFQGTMERHIAETRTGPSAANPPAATPGPDIPFPAVPSMSYAIPGVVPQRQPLATPPATPPVQSMADAAPGKPSEAQLAAREKYVLNGIQSINLTMTAEITRISNLYMSGRMSANQVNGQMATQYNFAIGAFQLLRVEASALNDLNKPEALRVLDLFVNDTKKALDIVGVMTSQQHAFELGISKIWQTTMTDITTTQLGINDATRKAFNTANEKYFSKF